ncbi:M23 family metallopeptidase [Reyranella sp.]|uniref:M23 family metallopeptidase n=1 Tax=Reyranella sp. TaxID=1929291 RepID=UPI0025CD1C97|nr:M23 family metallopeptidase [Reyranella sp.]
MCSVAGPLCFAATPEETRLLGSDREDAQFLSYMPFTRTLAVSGVVQGSLSASAEAAGVTPSAMLDALAAFASAIDLERDLRDGDRFYIRYERTYTVQGDAVGTGRVLWAELRTQAKGTLAIHRFRPLKASADSFWLSTGQAALPAGLKLPLDTVTVSSGFGMRADPFDQPMRGSLQQWRGKVTPAGKAPIARMAVKPLGGPPPSPLTNPASLVNVPTAAGIDAGLVAPGLKGFNGAGRAPMMMHEGVDLAADAGTPIHAAGDGVVKGAELKGGYGNWIEIEHDELLAVAPTIGKADGKPAKITTVYGHLSAFAAGIEPGTKVKQGDVIGYVGSTGRSTGPHLHFEILQNGHPTNPMISQMLRAEQLKGGELVRFKKVIAKDLGERQHEAGSI